MTVCGQLAGLGLERGGEFIIFGDSIRQCADKTSQCESGWPWVVSAGHFLSTLRRSLTRSLTHSLQELLQFERLLLAELVPKLLGLQLFLLVFLLGLGNGSVKNMEKNHLSLSA